MLIVISPSKALDFETKPSSDHFTQPRFLDQSKNLIDTLRQLDVTEVASLMSLSDNLAGLNVARYQGWQTPFNLDNAKQAMLAFKGDVYTGLDADTFTAGDADYAQTHLRILSGLYGVLKPLDLIQPYRLEMGTKLKNDSGDNLYKYWGAQLRESLAAEPALQDQVLINLASNEYFKAVDAKNLNMRLITPVFKDWKNGQYKIISFYAKKARGLMSRYVIANKLTEPDDLKAFDYDGYQFSAEMSKADEWVFTRDHAA
jgi:cytoplasmic iron level regulating protein YaaA (DUF328/UPF0246 family)